MEQNKIIKVVDGNEAAADIAYKVTELSALYPITPSTSMGELADQWAKEGKKNIWNFVPKVVEMQSEGGAIAALHGAVQNGALATTFTASQGLLLMIPNMYKIAGELTPAVIHVAARAIATQALSIFGDHSDVMAVRSTGWAMLASASVQEAHDMALIAHASTLASRVPFVHFFDGFRVSHEIVKIESLNDDDCRKMIDEEFVLAHRARALNPDHPFIRGTSHNPDTYFQIREVVNPFYTLAPKVVADYMNRFSKLFGRTYNLVDYYGDADAEKVIVIMGSGGMTARETVKFLQGKGDKVGVLQVRLFRPFPTEQVLLSLPKSTKCIAVLDRTKEPGSNGDPLYQDVVTALGQAASNNKLQFSNGWPRLIGVRYGLGSKEFTPAMVKAIFDEMGEKNEKNQFIIGINDDVENLSLSYDPGFHLHSGNVQAIFYGLGSDGTVGANKNTIKIIADGTELYTQGYFVYDSKKAGSQTVSHLRFGSEPINAPYLITEADFIGCHQFSFVMNFDVLKYAKESSTFLLNSPYDASEIFSKLPCPIQKALIKKKIKFYVIDAYKVAQKSNLGARINTIMQTCFFALAEILPKDEAIAKIKDAIRKTYAKKGEDIVRRNFEVVDDSLSNLKKVDVPERCFDGACNFPPAVSDKAPSFVQNFTASLMRNCGDDLPVSAFPIDGTYPSGTSAWEKRNVSGMVSCWNKDLCIQCGQCSIVCPHSVIRAKNYPSSLLKDAPPVFKSAKLRDKKWEDDRQFTLQVYLEDCTGCGLCHMVCPAVNKENPGEKAINIKEKAPVLEAERANIAFFESLPMNDRRELDADATRHVQYLEPLFQFSGACAGCGETPYIKMLSQLFGDRMLVANATGCSSIYGGNLPTTPWAFDANGRGPAWSNSLFEDNAEFGFGFSLAEDVVFQEIIVLLQEYKPSLGDEFVNALQHGMLAQSESDIAEQRNRMLELRNKLKDDNSEKVQRLLSLVDHMVKRSVWIVGGDGWAYDIGYGGLDHVLASSKDINVLVLDTGVYSNTGGQASKATPLGAVAKFASSGKQTSHKDLGLMLMSYGNVYVAQVAFGSNQVQALKAFKEAEAYNGPSLIIAYSHCIAHGFDMINGLEQQKLAVKSGVWPLYRYNPDRRAQNLNPLQLDSQPPSVPFAEYAYKEPRFSSLVKSMPERANELALAAQNDIDQKWKLYKKLAE